MWDKLSDEVKMKDEKEGSCLASVSSWLRPVLKHALEPSSRESMPACHVGIARTPVSFMLVQGRILLSDVPSGGSRADVDQSGTPHFIDSSSKLAASQGGEEEGRPS